MQPACLISPDRLNQRCMARPQPTRPRLRPAGPPGSRLHALNPVALCCPMRRSCRPLTRRRSNVPRVPGPRGWTNTQQLCSFFCGSDLAACLCVGKVLLCLRTELYMYTSAHNRVFPGPGPPSPVVRLKTSNCHFMHVLGFMRRAWLPSWRWVDPCRPPRACPRLATRRW